MTRQPIKKIALFGIFGGGNLGNEATLVTTLHMLRKRLPHVQIVLVSDPQQSLAHSDAYPEQYDHDPVHIDRIVNLIPYRFRTYIVPLIQLMMEPIRAWKTRKLARSFDLLLVSGTGIADDFYQTPFDTPLSLLRWCKAVSANRGKVRFISIGAGPVAHWLSRRWFRNSFRLADFRSYRETSSRDFAVSIGLHDGPETVLPDLVYGLPVTQYLEQYPINWPPKVIGLGVMYYRGWNLPDEEGQVIYERYKGKVVVLVKALLDRGYSVRIIIGNRTSDKLISKELSQLLTSSDQDKRLVFRPIDSYEDVVEEIALSDLVIASRFHNILKSCLLQRPVISIGYASKNDDLMDEVGLSEYCHHIESFEVDEVLNQVEMVSAFAEPPIQTVLKKNSEYRNLLKDQFDRVLQI